MVIKINSLKKIQFCSSISAASIVKFYKATSKNYTGEYAYWIYKI